MHIDYSKLWKLLIDKGLTKNELCELTGLSSRVLAKLAKNETVTTDTIARICAALNCNVGDIMDFSDDENLSLYATFRKNGKITDENEEIRTVRFSKGNKSFVVFVTKKKATKATRIHCKENETIYREQLYICGGISRPQIVESVLIKPTRQDDEIAIVLITGKPAIICGLDEGIFISHKRKPQSKKDIFVMSEAAFKLFEI